MYEEHPSFHFTPSAKIWRYMDFTKFVSILEGKSLYFPRIDQLGDPYELAMTIPSRNFLQPYAECFKQCVYVSCWHCNEYESAAMWGLYLKSDEGIAIQSTVDRLVESFSGCHDPIFIGDVHYIDYDKNTDFRGNMFDYAVLKRMSYSHEKELRAVHALHEMYEGRLVLSTTPGPDGMSIPVNLDQLIESVYVAPTAQSWLVDLVRKVVERYGLKVSITQSTLAKPP